MANLAFNLFDELENFDPRVEHFVQSRLEAARRKNALKPVANRDDNNANVSDANNFSSRGSRNPRRPTKRFLLLNRFNAQKMMKWCNNEKIGN